MARADGGTWPIAKQWPDTAVAQVDGRWFRLAHVGRGCYVIVDGPFGTYQRAVLRGHEAGEKASGGDGAVLPSD